MKKTTHKAPYACLQRIQQLLDCDQYREAEELVFEELQSQPSNADLHAIQASLCLWTQREIESVDHLRSGVGSERFDVVAQSVVDYFHCRALMAAKQGAKDPIGEEASAQLAEITNLEPSPNVGIGLTACLITKNESGNLARCLTSLKPVVDEIVVVDTGSTDNTIAIAESFGAKIGSFEWNESFADARNASLALATQPWVLWIDADEELDPSGVPMLFEGLMRPQFGGYMIRIQNFMANGSEADSYIHAPLRLFRNDEKVRFTGRIHEQIIASILDQGWKTADLEGVTLRHYGYLPEAMLEKRKVERSLRMLERELEDDPNNSFQLFNLANHYLITGEYEKSLEYILKSIESSNERFAFGASVYHCWAAALNFLGDHKGALSAVNAAEEADWHTLLTEFERTYALFHLERFDEALASAKTCCEMPWPRSLNGDYGIFTFKRWLLLGRIHGQIGHTDEAIAALSKALEGNPNSLDAHGLMGAVYFAAGRYADALLALKPCHDTRSTRAESLLLATKVALAASDLPTANAYSTRRMALNIWDDEGLLVATEVFARLQDANGIKLVLQNAASAGVDLNEAVTLKLAYQLGTFDVAEALAMYSHALRTYPQSANVFFCLGDFLYQIEQFQPAVDAYQNGLQLTPNFAQGWFVFGNALAQLGMIPSALEAYDQCLKLDPTHFGAAENSRSLNENAA